MSGPTGLNSKYNLPAPFPNICGIPEKVNSIKWLKIKDNTDRVFYIPAYYFDRGLTTPSFLQINNSSNDLVVVLNEGSSINFRINVENSALTPLVRTTNLLLRWNTANVTDLAIAPSSDGSPAPATSTGVWSIPVTNATFSNTISKNFTLEAYPDGQIENDEEHILIIEPESPGGGGSLGWLS